jgi:hypothetical protein
LKPSLHQVYAQIQAIGQLAIRYQQALEERAFEQQNQRIRNPTVPTKVYEPSSKGVNLAFGPGSP